MFHELDHTSIIKTNKFPINKVSTATLQNDSYSNILKLLHDTSHTPMKPQRPRQMTEVYEDNIKVIEVIRT